MCASPARELRTLGRRRRLQTRDYSVGWICALPIELAAAQEMLDEVDEAIPDLNDHIIYTLGRIDVHNVVLTCLPAGNTGTQSAANVAARMRSRFTSIRFGLMVGIGGGVPSVELDIRLGDVVISQPYQQHGGVVQYDFGKTEASRQKRTGWLNAPPPVLLSAIVEQRARHIRRQSMLESYLSKFKRLDLFSRESAGPDVLFNATYEHAGGPTCALCSNEERTKRPGRRGAGVGLHYGTIASGNQVMKDGVRRDQISKELGGVMCFEMEAAGLMNDFPCLVIRGICDYADTHKNKAWQPYAAATAAACAKEILTIVPGLPKPTARRMSGAPESGQTRVEVKLDQIMKELQLGYRVPAQVARDLRRDLVDDTVTEIDVEENKEFINEWLKSTEADGWLDEPANDQQNQGDEKIRDGRDRPSQESQGKTMEKKEPSLKSRQAYYENDDHEDEDEWFGNGDDHLSDAETEVAVEGRTPPTHGNFASSRPASGGARPQKTVKTEPRQRHPRTDRVAADHVERLSKKSRARGIRGQVREEMEEDYPHQDHVEPSNTPLQRDARSNQNTYPGTYVPGHSGSNPFYPSYGKDQRYDQPPYDESIYGSHRGNFPSQSHDDGWYDDSIGAVPPTRPLPMGLNQKIDAGNGSGFWTPDRRFMRYAPNPSQNILPNDGRARSAMNSYDRREMEGYPGAPPPSDSRSFHFNTGGGGGGFTFANPDSIFSEFLRGEGFNDRNLGPDRVQSPEPPSAEVTIVEKPLPLTLEELFQGTTKKMKIKRKTFNQDTRTTSTQDRILEVPIKKGLRAGSKIKFSDVGDQGPRSTQDLHFIVSEKPHPLFRREGDDIYHTIELNLLDSLCGWSRKVTTIDGKHITITSAGPTGPGWKDTFPGLGMPRSKKPIERGDMFVEVSVKYPKGPLRIEQRNALKNIFSLKDVE